MNLTGPQLAALLRAAEKAHAASGHDAAGWAEWYARWLLPRLKTLELRDITRAMEKERANQPVNPNGGWD